MKSSDKMKEVEEAKENELLRDMEKDAEKKIEKNIDAIKNSPVHKTIKRLFFYVLLFVGLMGITFWMIFKDQDLSKVLDTMHNANGFFVLLGLLLMVGYFAVEAWNIRSLLEGFGEKITFKQAFKFTMIGFFFCSVTPGASGGQPLEIYYMTREKISGPKATMAILIQTCGVQIAVITLGILGAIIGWRFMDGTVGFLFGIGFIINFVALLVLVLAIFSAPMIKNIAHAFLRFLKSKGVKKTDKWKMKIDEALDKYHESSIYIKNHKDVFKKSCAKVILQMSLFFLVPYCVYLAFGLRDFDIVTMFAMQAILFVSTSGLPLPGAIGASEAVFLSLFGIAFGGEMVDSAVLMNRGINFYWFVIVSMIVVFINIVILNKRKAERAVKTAAAVGSEDSEVVSEAEDADARKTLGKS